MLPVVSWVNIIFISFVSWYGWETRDFERAFDILTTTYYWYRYECDWQAVFLWFPHPVCPGAYMYIYWYPLVGKDVSLVRNFCSSLSLQASERWRHYSARDSKVCWLGLTNARDNKTRALNLLFARARNILFYIVAKHDCHIKPNVLLELGEWLYHVESTREFFKVLIYSFGLLGFFSRNFVFSKDLNIPLEFLSCCWIQYYCGQFNILIKYMKWILHNVSPPESVIEHRI